MVPLLSRELPEHISRQDIYMDMSLSRQDSYADLPTIHSCLYDDYTPSVPNQCDWRGHAKYVSQLAALPACC